MKKAFPPDRIAKFFEPDPTLTSYDTDWRSITLESFYLPSGGETPECCLEHYVVAINLGQNIQIRQVTENRCQKANFSQGMVVICPIYSPHFFIWDRAHPAIFLNLKPELLHSNASELLGSDRAELIPKFGFRDGLIYQIALALQSEIQTSASPDRLYAETLANALAVHLLRNYSVCGDRTPSFQGGLSPQKLKLVTEYVNDNLDSDLSLKELAAIAQLSQYHFCRLFKQSTRLSPYKYIIQCRVERAKQLLRKGDLNLAEIALSCGFSHQSHLHRHFKRLTRVTPKQFLNS